MNKQGQWYRDEVFFGIHYDLHASEMDTELGLKCRAAELVCQLTLMGARFAQCDCKGHAGYTSWRSCTPGASVPKGLKCDMLAEWRKATRILDIPLHCHYSGIWDSAVAKSHPDWCSVDATGKPSSEGRLCPRSPYMDDFMLPQMRELVDRYGVDGFWVDGEIWAVEFCYCDLCRQAYTEATGKDKPPVNMEDPDWPAWWSFNLDSFEAYVKRYCDKMHAYSPNIRISSAWLQTFQHPGEPAVPTDWISGDAQAYGPLPVETRFISTRGKPWDMMLWTFFRKDMNAPWCVKPLQMLQQEAALVMALGGNVMLYENPMIRDGRLVPWRQKRFGALGRYLARRRIVCQNTQTVPQIAILHSEHHLRRTMHAKNLLWDVKAESVRGATNALIEEHFGVDVLDEWAILPRLSEFKVVVVPEQHALSATMVKALKAYVSRGGNLLVTGSECCRRFGGAFLGVKLGKAFDDATWHIIHKEEVVPLKSRWRLATPVGAKPFGRMSQNQIAGDAIAAPPAVVNTSGKGRVACVPAGIFRDYHDNIYPHTRVFIGALTRKLAGRMDVEMRGPTCVQMILRRRRGDVFVHVLNSANGLRCVVDQIPPVGPLEFFIKLDTKPKQVRALFEKEGIEWTFRQGRLHIVLPCLHIHETVRISTFD